VHGARLTAGGTLGPVIARAWRAGWVFLSAAAVAGVVLAHAIAYAVAYPDPHLRSEHLHSSGHGYWAAAVYLAVALGAAALAWAVARGADAGRAARTDVVVRFGPLAVRQVFFFALVEVSERVAAGVPVTDLWREPAFVVGLAVQVAVAAGLAFLLRHAEDLGARVAAVFRPPPGGPRAGPRWWTPSWQSPPRQLLRSPARSRAPPGPAVAAAH
jgi:hypothetical protein